MPYQVEKKYQVFVSSRYDDLIEERQKVLQGILENGCFPALMELFIASGRAPWEQIKEGIEGYDYFIVISAGNY